MLQTKKTMCKECYYAKIEMGNGNPNHYYCTNPKARFARSKCEPTPLICKTERHSTELTIKTRPRWCPLSDAEQYSYCGEGVINIKKVLDACCGSRMFYFDRQNPEVIYADNRELETTLCDGRTLMIKPDVKMDFREMPYQDSTFKVVVFDPPHLIHAGTGSWLANKYGVLPVDWPEYLKQGFDECIRVLEPAGVLVFKWNEDQIKLSDVLKVFEKKPLLGDQRGKTRWLVFIK